uniref:Uncharacterized protein n=1 Tax=Oryza nivara TaxID=4536 RepID=A0A0E0HGB6_ORYNI
MGRVRGDPAYQGRSGLEVDEPDSYTVVSGARPKCWQRQCRVRQNSDAVLARLAGNGDPVRQGTSKISASWVLPCTL